MLYNEPINCLCGQRPKLLTRKIGGDNVDYFYYACEKCGISTFSTRLEEFCRELWCATVNRRKLR